MNDELAITMRVILIGVGATVVMDAWAVLLKRCFGIPSLDWAMVGRWLGHLPQGRFFHERIAAASAVRGERIIGWAAHYVTGVVFAAALVAVSGIGWARQPTLLPSLVFGVFTVAAPFLVMQPGMGAGIAASKTPNPPVARLRSLVTHAVFGVGLYGSALLTALLMGA
ncbi:DUF2938 domain-containing protein [Arhodomonas sp. AD133]|uniref:DUF2938 domain-containing protein n=1 Tax=Arhodomonas sp. AD133 TaxID=3415009 RepID=UPI003EBFE92C